MQYRPDASVLLRAVALFLETQVRPAMPDKALAFRVRVAAWLAQVVAVEIAGDEALDLQEMGGLFELLGVDDRQIPSSQAERRARLTEMNEQLSAHLREGELAAGEIGDVSTHLRAILAGRLAGLQPAFDTRTNIE